MFNQPTNKTMMICLFDGQTHFVLFLKLDKAKRFLYGKTLIEEGIVEVASLSDGDAVYHFIRH